MKVNPLPVKVFSRDNPVTKIEIFNTFRVGKRFVARPAIEARGIMGGNAIKYLIREDYAFAFTRGGVDYWELTPAGQEWLMEGLKKFLLKHPERAGELAENPFKTAPKVSATRRITRTK